MVEATVLKKIPGFGYFPHDKATFQKEVAEALEKGGFILIVKAEKIEKNGKK